MHSIVGYTDRGEIRGQRLSDYLRWLAEQGPDDGHHDPAWGTAAERQLARERGEGRYRPFRTNGPLEVLSCDAMAVRHSNGAVNHFCHPWGELRVRCPEEDDWLGAPAPFALPLTFCFDEVIYFSTGEVIGEIENYDPALLTLPTRPALERLLR